ncbi:hypothetical protein [Thermocoleostomius sinensis]|uniref:Uncharacterized protein n=1 Tax=Thermocoleostomius sinensis A174 TaxID=2016057 RepID=A0A9E8ZHM6_9CYAN|nr:hypothetical protein [Thermocoleostomius sinensis]WAL61917.1 hypothetical protein OXH18_08015 [Thermocoleostomius sinensis A174]
MGNRSLWNERPIYAFMGSLAQDRFQSWVTPSVIYHTNPHIKRSIPLKITALVSLI